MGDITIELYPEQAPITVANFLQYVRNAHYVGTIFHRVMKNFMIQGGIYKADLTRKDSLPPIVNEAANGLNNICGTIAMARRDDVDSAQAQFFINTANNRSLNHKSTAPDEFGYCVFGKVIQGLDIVEKINSIEITSIDSFQHLPSKTIEILEVIELQPGKQ